MGMGNVKAAYAYWADKLPGRPFQVLVWMCLNTRDHDEPPTYFAGREHLALGLGIRVPDEEGPERRRAFRALENIVGVLKSAGAISVTKPATARNPTVYAVHRTPRNVGAQAHTKHGGSTDPSPHETGGASPHETGASAHTKRVLSPHETGGPELETNERNKQTSGEEGQETPVTNGHHARGRETYEALRRRRVTT